MDWNLCTRLYNDYSYSHSLRGSVDWNHFLFFLEKHIIVTPCVGVWIEIYPSMMHSISGNCHSLRGSVDWNLITITCVRLDLVTPCVGVWIEIHYYVSDAGNIRSLPAWECGLKCFCHLSKEPMRIVTPCVGVWIEIVRFPVTRSCIVCHSLRGSVDWNAISYTEKSCRLVTPCVGVWIEMLYISWFPGLTYRHSLRGSVDWNLAAGSYSSADAGHSLRGSVDWNISVYW